MGGWGEEGAPGLEEEKEIQEGEELVEVVGEEGVGGGKERGEHGGEERWVDEEEWGEEECA